jgi:hypothetical protein
LRSLIGGLRSCVGRLRRGVLRMGRGGGEADDHRAERNAATDLT